MSKVWSRLFYSHSRSGDSDQEKIHFNKFFLHIKKKTKLCCKSIDPVERLENTIFHLSLVCKTFILEWRHPHVNFWIFFAFDLSNWPNFLGKNNIWYASTMIFDVSTRLNSIHTPSNRIATIGIFILKMEDRLENTSILLF